MLFRLFDQFSYDPRGALINFLAFTIALVVGITVHEFSHAFSAYRLGDNTAKNQGRLTLNPKAHLDPLGTIMILVGGFGWGRPTPVTPWNLRIGEKAGMAVVSFAGPISNVIVAFLVALVLRLYLDSSGQSTVIVRLLLTVVQLNLILAIFNLLPIAPLDGFKIALGLLPRKAAISFARTERYGMMVLILVIMAGIVLDISILGPVINPIIENFIGFVLGL